jgi:DUF2950 family protein
MGPEREGIDGVSVGAAGRREELHHWGGKRRFAFVAYPAEYRSSGLKTFVMSADGVIYEKDLGVKTESVAQGMKEFNPGAGWKKTEVEMPSTDATAKKQ